MTIFRHHFHFWILYKWPDDGPLTENFCHIKLKYSFLCSTEIRDCISFKSLKSSLLTLCEKHVLLISVF
jgi:hypothetical protein